MFIVYYNNLVSWRKSPINQGEPITPILSPAFHPLSLHFTLLFYRSILADLAILTGGPCSRMNSTPSSNVLLPIYWISSNSTLKAARMQAHCKQTRSLIADPTTSEFDRTKLQERFTKLSGGVGTIKVGGSLELELGEKKDRCKCPRRYSCCCGRGYPPWGWCLVTHGLLRIAYERTIWNFEPTNIPLRSRRPHRQLRSRSRRCHHPSSTHQPRPYCPQQCR